MLGYTAAEVMNKITPADISDPQEVIARAKALSVELGTPITPGFEALVFKASRGIEDIYELTYIRKDGSRFPAVVSVTALRDAQDAIIGYLLIGTDNTARKQAEEALLKAGALQSAIFNSANFSSIATDAKGVIQIFNVGAERMLGYTAAEVMNKITPADISDPQEVIARAKALSVELGTPITPGFEALVFKASRGIEDIYELTYIRKDGSRFPAVVSVTALRDAQDAIIGYLLIGTDNTARKQAEEALLKAGALQSAIFNSANFSSIATDAKGVIQIFNVGAERMLGYTAAEVMNKITPADISDPQEVIARAKALSVELGTPITPGFEALVFKASRGIEDIYELTYIRKDGSRFPAVVSVTALRDAQDAIIGYLLIGTDNTARKQAEEALLKAGALQSAIFNSANFSSIATDAKGVIQIFNVGAERMLGYTAAEVMNKITPADISDPQEVIARAKALSVELGTPITPGFEALVFKASRGIEDIYELTYIRKDGSRFPAVVSVTALRDAQDAIIGYLLIGTDNTARKQVEEEQKKLDQRLRDQQFYTRSLIESNIDALMTTDPSRHHHRRQQADGGAHRLHARRADRRAVQELLHRSGAGRGRHQARAEREEGHRLRADRARPRRQADRGVLQRDHLLRPRPHAAGRLRRGARRHRAQARRGGAAAGQGRRREREPDQVRFPGQHEPRDPHADERDHGHRRPAREDRALAGAGQVRADLPPRRRQPAQPHQRHPRPLQGRSLAARAGADRLLAERPAGEGDRDGGGAGPGKGLALVCEIAPDVPTDLVGDPTRLRQVLLNLLGNAIKFTESGEVSLRVDAGCGPLGPDRPAVHRLGHRHRHSAREAGPGVRALHAGRLVHHAPVRRLGAGAHDLQAPGGADGRAHLGRKRSRRRAACFPSPCRSRSAAAANRPAAAPVGAGPEPPLPALRILLAEDSPDNCTITIAYLEDTPYQVEIAETGAIACEMFDGRPLRPRADGPADAGHGRPDRDADDPRVGAGQRPAADADHRADGLRPEGRSRNVPGGRLHGLLDQADQARGAAAGDSIARCAVGNASRLSRRGACAPANTARNISGVSTPVFVL